MAKPIATSQLRPSRLVVLRVAVSSAEYLAVLDESRSYIDPRQLYGSPGGNDAVPPTTVPAPAEPPTTGIDVMGKRKIEID